MAGLCPWHWQCCRAATVNGSPEKHIHTQACGSSRRTAWNIVLSKCSMKTTENTISGKHATQCKTMIVFYGPEVRQPEPMPDTSKTTITQ